MSIAALLKMPLDEPPTIVPVYGGFGSSLHGLRGAEPYRNAFWVVNLIERGEGSIQIANESHAFSPHCAVIAPPGVDHCYNFGQPTRKIFAHFLPIPSDSLTPFPVVQNLGARFEWFKTSMLQTACMVKTESNQARAMLWHLLWQLSTRPQDDRIPINHPVIRALMAWMVEHLADPVQPDKIAFQFDCSAAHLNRLCHAAFGLPLLSYIRQCRLERAGFLLQHTTKRIADIAAEVGYPDIHHFNKLIRRHFGRSPRMLRATEDLP